jgi:hypothetical protein
MTLRELIKTLSETDPALTVRHGWDCAFSYRGDYSQLAVRQAENVPVTRMARVLLDSVDQIMQGYKGGDYRMHEYVDVYLVEDRSSCGEQIGPLLLKYMLADSARETEVK